MRLIQRQALFVPMAILWVACTTKRESEPLAPENLIDKRVLPVPGNGNTTRVKKTWQTCFPMHYRPLKAYPHGSNSATRAILAPDLCAIGAGHSETVVPYGPEALPHLESYPEFQLPLMKHYDTGDGFTGQTKQIQKGTRVPYAWIYALKSKAMVSRCDVS
jgi:hypothetical protein